MATDPPIIFIIGAGRTGSTIFHRILCEHPQVAWLTSLAERAPGKPGRNQLLMRAVDWPLAGRYLRRWYPHEVYQFWERHCPGFRRPCRDLTAADVSERSRKQVRQAFARIATARRPHLTVKITGWPRIGMLAEVFPEAKFVHLARDGRSVANSFLNVPWWHGWFGPENWRWGPLPETYAAEWERHDRSFVALAGISWKIFMDALEKAKAALPEGRMLDLSYEQLCKEKEETYKKVLQFCGIPESEAFDRRLAGFELRDASPKWRRHLSTAQQAVLEDVLSSHLQRYGYRSDGDA